LMSSSLRRLQREKAQQGLSRPEQASLSRLA
jgi:hypothetical protein